MKTLFPKNFIVTLLITSIWVNASEVFRYFVIVVPALRAHLSVLPDFAPVTLPVALVWGAWDTILTGAVVFLTWTFVKEMGSSLKTVLIAGTSLWVFFFLLYWIGMVNMNLSGISTALIALPLAWFELVVAAFIASKLIERQARGNS